MVKGDKIKLIKPIGIFSSVGEICEVINVTDTGVISFVFNGGRSSGCMSYDEYLKHFELVQPAEKKPSVWTDWKLANITYYDLGNEYCGSEIYYKHNGKRVKVKCPIWGVKTEACCHHEDEFDLAKGLNLAKFRLIVKILDRQVQEIAEGM